MKKIIAVLCSLCLFIGLFGVAKIEGQATQQDIAKKLIRFHVIANSDSIEDQALKLKVRDKILEYVSPKLKNSHSIEESRKIIKDNDINIKKIAQETVVKNKCNYSVATMLSHENFPVKTYGNITLPQGKYEAYRIIIGSGKGHNWWCVMFPPLCFTDITKGEVSYKETEKEMKEVLSDKEYALINNFKTNTYNGEKLELKLKSVEILKKILGKFK